MREAIHSIGCPCIHCRRPAEEPAVPELSAAVQGLIVGIAFGAILAAIKHVPQFIAWIMQS